MIYYLLLYIAVYHLDDILHPDDIQQHIVYHPGDILHPMESYLFLLPELTVHATSSFVFSSCIFSSFDFSKSDQNK